MMKFAVIACALLVVVAASDIKPEVLKCRIDVSTAGWLKVANISSKLAVEAPAALQTALETIHDQMKGSADIINALPDVATLSREAQFQLNQNCILAPVSIESIVSLLRAKYPDFAEQHAQALKDIEAVLDEIRKGLKDCENKSV